MTYRELLAKLSKTAGTWEVHTGEARRWPFVHIRPRDPERVTAAAVRPVAGGTRWRWWCAEVGEWAIADTLEQGMDAADAALVAGGWVLVDSLDDEVAR